MYIMIQGIPYGFYCLLDLLFTCIFNICVLIYNVYLFRRLNGKYLHCVHVFRCIDHILDVLIYVFKLLIKSYMKQLSNYSNIIDLI